MHKQRLIIVGVVVFVLAAVVIAALSLAPPAAPEMTLDEIRARMDAGEYAAVREALLAYVAASPNDAEARFRLGLTHFNLNEYDLAREQFTTALALDPERAPAVHHNLGVLNYQVGDFTGAVQEFQAALAQDPDDADTHYQLGATYLVMAIPAIDAPPDFEKLAQAEAEFSQALALAPDKPEALVGLGNIYLLQNDPDAAIEVLGQAVEMAPRLPEALFALGRAYLLNGQLDAARETFQRFLQADPPEMWAQQVEILLSQMGP